MSSFKSLPAAQASDAPKTGFWSIERVVAALTPVFAAAAGLLTSLAGQVVPGVSLNKGDVTVMFTTGAVVAGGAALKWLHGRSQWTRFETDAEKQAKLVEQRVRVVLAEYPQAQQALDNVKQMLADHETQIITSVGNLMHAPASADAIAEQVVRKLLPSGGAQAAATAAQGAAPAQ